MSYRLKLTEPLERSVRRVGLAQIDAAIVRLRAERDPEHVVHMARKGLKKLRALLRLVRPGLDDGVFDHENARFRDIARELSAMRDQHVLAETVNGMAAICDGAAKTAFTALAKRLNAVPSVGETPTATNTATKSDSLLEAVAAHLEWARSAFEEISVAGGYDTAFTGIADSFRKARRAMHHGFTTLDAEDLHEFRKHTQHHWRHMQLVSAAWPEYFEARAATARRLSTILGEDHDLEMLAQHVSGRDGPKLTVRQKEHVLSAIEARQTKLRADARRLGQQLFADSPGSFGETVAFHWATAREGASNIAAEAAAAE